MRASLPVWLCVAWAAACIVLAAHTQEQPDPPCNPDDLGPWYYEDDGQVVPGTNLPYWDRWKSSGFFQQPAADSARAAPQAGPAPQTASDPSQQQLNKLGSVLVGPQPWADAARAAISRALLVGLQAGRSSRPTDTAVLPRQLTFEGNPPSAGIPPDKEQQKGKPPQPVKPTWPPLPPPSPPPRPPSPPPPPFPPFPPAPPHVPGCKKVNKHRVHFNGRVVINKADKRKGKPIRLRPPFPPSPPPSPPNPPPPPGPPPPRPPPPSPPPPSPSPPPPVPPPPIPPPPSPFPPPRPPPPPPQPPRPPPPPSPPPRPPRRKVKIPLKNKPDETTKPDSLFNLSLWPWP